MYSDSGLVNRHQNVKPLREQQLCGRHFSQAANLKTHIRNTHADEDPSVIAALSAAVAPLRATAYSSTLGGLCENLR